MAMTADVGSLHAMAAALAECAQEVELAESRLGHMAEPLGASELPGHVPVRQLAEQVHQLLAQTQQLLAVAHTGVTGYAQECAVADQVAQDIGQQCAASGHHWDGADQVFPGPGLTAAEQLADSTLGSVRASVEQYLAQTASASRALHQVVDQVATDAARLGTR